MVGKMFSMVGHMFDNTVTTLFEHTVADEDGTYDGLVYPPSHNHYVWWISWINLPAGLYAIYRGYYDICPVPLGVFATSLLYWKHPKIKGWERIVDMSYVFCALSYQCVRAVGAQYMIPHYTVMGMAIMCYPVSEYYHKRHSWVSVGFHSLIHVFGTLANVILYSGEMKDI